MSVAGEREKIIVGQKHEGHKCGRRRMKKDANEDRGNSRMVGRQNGRREMWRRPQ